jgi:hypothetical protein
MRKAPDSTRQTDTIIDPLFTGYRSLHEDRDEQVEYRGEDDEEFQRC